MGSTKSGAILITILFYLVGPVLAQEPFVCDGSFYLVLKNHPTEQSKLYKMVSSQNLSEIVFEEVGVDSTGVNLNSIGYRKTDNLIYGINPQDHNLYQIDKSGRAFLLDRIEELDTLRGYIAGDVSLDGRYLILIERDRVDLLMDVKLVFIDLTDPEFAVTKVDLMGENGEPPFTRTADVAINPFNGLMYGYNARSRKLSTFNLETGVIQTENFQNDLSQPEVLGALFFDDFGRLLGYGRQRDSIFQNTLFQIDINTGLAEILDTGPMARGNDGCKCVNRIGIQKTVSPPSTLPCTNVTYTVSLSNPTGTVVENISMTDSLDLNLRFSSVIDNPFSGTLVVDSINNILHFNNLTLEPGIDSIVFSVFVKPTSSAGLINNQAQLTDLPPDQEPVIYSDYPSTLVRGDPTPLEILEALEVNEIYHDTIICLDEELTLISQFPNGDHTWNGFDEEKTSRLEINNGGSYYLTTVVGCQVITEIFQVEEEWISFSLGEDQNIDLGEFIQISPTIQSTSPDSVYRWIGNDPAICPDCPSQDFIPLENQTVSLSITNQAGCVSQDSIDIFVTTDRSVFVPNAFSPNSDGINDLLFASTKIPQQILYFRIYNRWGALVFQNENGLTNDPAFGWNGNFKGEMVNNDVFVFDMLLLYPDGVKQKISGDITVIK